MTNNEYVEIDVRVKFSTNQVEIRNLLNSIAVAAEHNATRESSGSPQQKTQLSIAAICHQAAQDIFLANKKHWESQ